MTTADAFLQSIVETPDDDAPRLIFADWLDEHGESERGEFIRVQCELARWPCECDEVERVYHDECRCKEKGELQQRQRALFNEPRNFINWTPRLFHTGSRAGIWVMHAPEVQLTGKGFVMAAFRRGFINRLVCTCAAWLEHGPAIVQAQPVERVDISDKKPAWSVRLGFPVGWLRQLDFPSGQHRDDELPDELFNRLKKGPRCRHLNPNWFGCDDEAVALDALSAACLAWAKEQPCPM